MVTLSCRPETHLHLNICLYLNLSLFFFSRDNDNDSLKCIFGWIFLPCVAALPGPPHIKHSRLFPYNIILKLKWIDSYYLRESCSQAQSRVELHHFNPPIPVYIKWGSMVLKAALSSNMTFLETLTNDQMNQSECKVHVSH